MKRRLDQFSFSPSIAHFLTQAVEKEEPPHFLLFHAANEEYVSQIAKAFLLDWLASSREEHADLLTLEPEGKALVHTMENIRSFLGELSLTPFAGKKRAVIIRHIERMQPASSNALLKTLEEPPSHTVIIGTTERPYRLLPTIRSRAQEIAFTLAPTKGIQEEALIALVKDSWPLTSFTKIFTLCQAIETLIQEKKDPSDDSARALFLDQERAASALHDIISFLTNEGYISSQQRSSFLAHCQEVFSSLEKQTALKDVLTLFFSFRLI